MDLAAFANKLGADMMRAQAAGSPRETKMDDAYDWIHQADDRQAADELQAERRENTLAALYSAAMLGLQEEDLRHLCAECGVTYDELAAWTPHILRRKEQQPDGTAPF